MNVNDHRAPFGGAGQRVGQHGAMALAADEHRLAALRRRALGAACGLGGGRPQSSEHLAPARPRAGIAAKQLDTEGVQIVGQTRHQLFRRWRLEPLLVHQDIEHPTRERPTPGERLVNHHADAVPVARLRDFGRRRLFRGHICGGADDLSLAALVLGLERGRGDQAEVHQDHTPLPRHHHIRRLDVAMKLARLVQRREPFGKLLQDPSKFDPVLGAHRGRIQGRNPRVDHRFSIVRPDVQHRRSRIGLGRDGRRHKLIGRPGRAGSRHVG